MFPYCVDIPSSERACFLSPIILLGYEKNCGLVRREHEPSGRPKFLLLSETRDTIVTTNIYLSFSEETGSLFGSIFLKNRPNWALIVKGRHSDSSFIPLPPPSHFWPCSFG